MQPSRGPRLATALVRLAVGSRRGRDLLRELEQEYRTEVCPRMVPRHARRWFWRESLSLSGWYLHLRARRLIERLSPGRTSPRSESPWIMTTMLQDFGHDLRYGLRLLRIAPSYAAVVVLTLAIGIGATAAIFSIVDGVVLRPLPYENPEQLVRVWSTDSDDSERFLEASYDDFLDFRERSRSFAVLSAFSLARRNLMDDYSTPAQVILARVAAPGLLQAIGVQPLLGRDFAATELARGNSVVILAHALWQQRYGADPDIVGKSIRIDDVAHAVIGVMPANYAYPRTAMLWRPFTREELGYRDDDRELIIMGRLADGVDVETAGAELDRIAAQLADERPDTNTGIGAWAQPLRAMLVRDVRQPLLMLLGAVTLVLLVVSANITALSLARGARREHEVAVRAALGASRSRIIRQSLTESLLLASLGGVLGVLVGRIVLRLLVRLTPDELPRLVEITLDGRVMGVMAVVTLTCGLLFGLLPALQTASGNPRAGLGGDGASGTTRPIRIRLQKALIVAEVGLAVALSIGAALLFASFVHMTGTDRGFRTDNLLAVGVDLPEQHDSAADPSVDYQRIIERIQALPGVASVAVGRTHPLQPWGINLRVFQLQGLPQLEGEPPPGFVRMVSPGYFDTAGIPLRTGRGFNATDVRESAGVAIVNEAFARAYFGGDAVIGKQFVLPGWGDNPDRPFEIVGLVADVTVDVGRDDRPALYFAHTQLSSPSMQVLVRTTGDGAVVAGSVREAIWEIVPGVPLDSLATMQQLLDAQVASPRFSMRLLGAFSAIALGLAGLGIYGVVSFNVARRTREIGIRQALGAERQRILRMVMRESLTLAAIGVGLGLAGALGLAGTLRGLLYGVQPTDPTVTVAVVALVAATALVATWLPARRAMNVDPSAALASD